MNLIKLTVVLALISNPPSTHAGWFDNSPSGSKLSSFAGIELGTKLEDFKKSNVGKTCKDLGESKGAFYLDCTSANSSFESATVSFFKGQLFFLAITFKGQMPGSGTASKDTVTIRDGIVGKFGKPDGVIPYLQQPIGERPTQLLCQSNRCNGTQWEDTSNGVRVQLATIVFVNGNEGALYLKLLDTNIHKSYMAELETQKKAANRKAASSLGF